MSIDRLHESDQAAEAARLEGLIMQRDAVLAEKLAVKTREARRFHAGALFFAGVALFMIWGCDVLMGKLDHEREVARHSSDHAAAARSREDDAIAFSAAMVQERDAALVERDSARRQTADVTRYFKTAVSGFGEAVRLYGACQRGAR